MAESKGLLAWRRKQPRGTIMKPSTFDTIARGPGGKKAAGSAYWGAARAKYRAAQGRKNPFHALRTKGD